MSKRLSTMMFRCLLLTTLLSFSYSFVLRSDSSRVPPLRVSSSTEKNPDEIRKDIESMRKQALEKLDELEHQVEELRKIAPPPAKQVTKKESIPKANSLDHLEGDLTRFPPPTDTTAAAAVPIKPVFQPNDIELLEDSRWKIVFSIGREPGTWMPKEWGAKGDRIRFEVIVDFTDEPYYERDDFFQGVADAKVLNVVDSFVFPFGTGSDSHGRQKLRIQSKGGYKVIRGMGPMGTDILRFFIELDDMIARDDVYCPKGKIYGTCGYFPTHSDQAIEINAWKDNLAKAYHKKITMLEDLKRQADRDTRLFSFDQLKRMKTMMELNGEIQKIADQQREARARLPEKRELRLSRDGDVGLSREGGVCCRVHKGLSVEYHILGRMEVASVQKREEHDEYHELVDKLHP